MGEQESEMGPSPDLGQESGPEISPEPSVSIEADVGKPPETFEEARRDSPRGRMYGGKLPFLAAAIASAAFILGEKTVSLADRGRLLPPVRRTTSSSHKTGDLVRNIGITLLSQEAEKLIAHKREEKSEETAREATRKFNAGVKIESLAGETMFIEETTVVGARSRVDERVISTLVGSIFQHHGATLVEPQETTGRVSRGRRTPVSIESNLRARARVEISSGGRDLRTRLGRGAFYDRTIVADLGRADRTAFVYIDLIKEGKSGGKTVRQLIGTIVGVGKSSDQTKFSVQVPGVQVDDRRFGDAAQARAISSALENASQAIGEAQHEKRTPTIMGEIQDYNRETQSGSINIGSKDGVKPYEIFGLAQAKQIKDPKTGEIKEALYVRSDRLVRVKTVFDRQAEIEVLDNKLNPVPAEQAEKLTGHRLIPYSDTSIYKQGVKEYQQEPHDPDKGIIAPLATRR